MNNLIDSNNTTDEEITVIKKENILLYRQLQDELKVMSALVEEVEQRASVKRIWLL